MTDRKARRLKRRRRYNNNEDVNPMNFVSNLSDVMLILAVGIMLALVAYYQVPIDSSGDTEQNVEQEAVSFSDDDLENLDEIPDEMEKMGDVYYDSASGKYYIIESAD